MDNSRTGLGVVQAIIQATHALPDIPHLVFYPHNSNPNSAAALLRHEDAATSAAGAFDADSSGSDATAE